MPGDEVVGGSGARRKHDPAGIGAAEQVSEAFAAVGEEVAGRCGLGIKAGRIGPEAIRGLETGLAGSGVERRRGVVVEVGHGEGTRGRTCFGKLMLIPVRVSFTEEKGISRRYQGAGSTTLCDSLTDWEKGLVGGRARCRSRTRGGELGRGLKTKRVMRPPVVVVVLPRRRDRPGIARRPSKTSKAKHSSRNRLWKLSAYPFFHGLPGSMESEPLPVDDGSRRHSCPDDAFSAFFAVPSALLEVRHHFTSN